MRTRPTLSCSLALTLAAMLAGCAGGLHSDAPLQQAYVLRAPAPAASASDPQGSASVRVMRPLAAPGLDTERIVLLQSDRRLGYFAGSSWAGALPDVIESLTVQVLRDSHAWSAVEGGHSSFQTDYFLQITLQRFEADYTEQPGAPVVHVVLDCTLGRRADHALVTAFSVAATQAAAENRLSAVVGAFEHAADTALADAAQRAAQALRTSPAPSPPASDKSSS